MSGKVWPPGKRMESRSVCINLLQVFCLMKDEEHFPRGLRAGGEDSVVFPSAMVFLLALGLEFEPCGEREHSGN